MLEHFASLFGLSQEEVLSVQLDEQTDSKVGKLSQRSYDLVTVIEPSFITKNLTVQILCAVLTLKFSK